MVKGLDVAEDVVFAAAGVTDSQLPPDVVEALVVNESAAPVMDVVNVTG